MNLAFEPWIPVRTRDGLPARASLLDVFREDYDDLAVRPHERIALMRLLIAVASAALDGPADRYSRDEAAESLPEAVVAYLERWRDSFDLFHPERPFLQVAEVGKSPRSKDDAATQVSKLDFALASGNNSSLFDHAAIADLERGFSPPAQALMLLTFQNFACSGKIGWITWKGIFNWKDKIDKKGKKQDGSKPDSASHAPCTPAAMLHLFLRGDSLRRTVVLNLIDRQEVGKRYPVAGWGRPVWERPPSGPDDTDAIANATLSYLGRLVPMSRLIRLTSDGRTLLLADGLDYPAFPGFVREPSACERVKRDGQRVLVGADLGRSVWRQLPALLLRNLDAAGGRPGAVALSYLDDAKPCDLWVGALVTHKQQAANILDVVESSFHLPAGALSDIAQRLYEKEIDYAEGLAMQLGWALETYRSHVDGGWQSRLKLAGPKKREVLSQLHERVTRHFWKAAEGLSPGLLEWSAAAAGAGEDLPEQRDRQWRRPLQAAAREAYRLACSAHTPRQQRAYALGWAKINPQPKGGQDE